MSDVSPDEPDLRASLRTLERLSPDPVSLDAVHVGAARRRHRRQAAVAGTALIAAAAVFGVVTLAPDLGRQSDVLPGDATPLPSPSPSTAPSPSASPSLEQTPPPPAPIDPSAFAAAVTAVSAVDDQTWYVAVDTSLCAADCPVLASTTDGGQHYFGLPDPAVDGSFSTLRVVDYDTVFALVGDPDQAPAQLVGTVDGGEHWKPYDVEGTILQLEAGAGEAYVLTRQSDHELGLWRWDGSEWLHRATFPTADAGTTALTTMLGEAYVEFHSEPTSGRTVVRIDGSSQILYDSPCVPELGPTAFSGAADALWISCAQGTTDTVYRSLDSGRHWAALVPPGSASRFTPLAAGGPDNAVAATGAGSLVALTPDAAPLPADLPTGFGDVGVASLEMSSPTSGLAVTLDHRWLRTTDGGMSWQAIG